MQDFAETVALEALAWLVGDEELLPVFLGATGASAGDLRDRASEPEFLASVLDFLLLDDAWVLRFCASCGRPGEAVMAARASLPGGADPHWT
ncbi:DUF3572 domain-containing protein [Rhodovulum sulfidophilum]|uniref:DUF3572 domain-containing protein n=1 Tax=Rhodovulum sulfidophilum TaxID=35806 RepID=UPI001F4383E6|nr:DUF3572 domain-containing protein [Rhodovulum sulfidophilum]MCE8441586.1 DUF3572 domain-containing protein [Rhodovulum sulfidophilum]MCE8471135.1 DUF3572 domain-containing protein [Rhodovulum sulfidophilum]